MAYFGFILLIEDNKGDQRLVEEALNAVEFHGQVEVVSDGDMALRLLSERISKKLPLPDLIILDLSLPRKDGKEILKSIREQYALKTVPVVVFTSSELSSDIEQCYTLGANSYVVKHGSIDAYFSTIAALVKFWFGTARRPGQH